MNPSIETRAFAGMELRDADGPGVAGILAGVAAPFDRKSKPIAGLGRRRPFVETIARGAFTDTLRQNRDVLFLWAHDNDAPIARTPRTLTLNETSDGLRFEAHVPDTALGVDLVKNVRAGIVSGMSFAFRMVRETWAAMEDFDLRTLLEVELFEISATTMPAYPDSTVAARSHQTFCEIREACPDLQVIVQANGRFEYGDGRTPLRDYWQARIAEMMAKSP